MYYFPKHNLGFFHIPKTGGTSMSWFIINALRERGDLEQEITKNLWHEPLGDKVDILGREIFDNSIILTTIRNPYAVVVSLYFWCKLKVEKQHFDLKDYPDTERVASMDFVEYMSWYMENEQPFEQYFLQQGRIPGNLRILRLENINSEANQVLNNELGLNIEITLPVSNSSRHGPVMSYLTNEFIRQINLKHAWTFDNFYRKEKAL